MQPIEEQVICKHPQMATYSKWTRWAHANRLHGGTVGAVQGGGFTLLHNLSGIL